MRGFFWVVTLCHWCLTGGYRGPNCGYTGGYVTKDGVPTDNPELDECDATLGRGCIPRFGEGTLRLTFSSEDKPHDRHTEAKRGCEQDAVPVDIEHSEPHHYRVGVPYKILLHRAISPWLADASTCSYPVPCKSMRYR